MPPIFWNNFEGGINHLSSTFHIALLRQLFVETIEQGFHQIQFFEMFTKQPGSFDILYFGIQLQSQKVHEGQLVVYLVFDAVVGKVVQLLQHRYF